MATHSSILAWKIPWTEETGSLQFMRSQRVGHDWSDLARMQTMFLAQKTEIVRILIIAKLICRLNTIPESHQKSHLKKKIDKLILRFIWKCRESWTVKTILKKNRVGGFIIPDFKTCYKATVSKTVILRLKMDI